MNDFLLIFLRIVHVVGGTLWVGTAVFYLFFIKPTVKAIGPAGPQFMQNLAEWRKYPLFMMSASLLTVLAGLALYLYTSGGFNPSWILSGTGLGFTIGALAALVAFLVGSLVIGPTSGRMGALGKEIGMPGMPPTPEQIGVLHALEKKLALAEQIDFLMLTIAMLTMATARYWTF
jgi:uncharacterized membrane protein